MEFSLGGARDTLQVDVGIGDVMEPCALSIDIPSELGFPTIRMPAYAKELVVAEKLEAMVTLGIRNSRMKDFYDIRDLSRKFEFDGAQLARSIRATFLRRQTIVPTDAPLALTRDFSSERTKQQQWIGFLRKGNIATSDDNLESTIDELSLFLMPPLKAVSLDVAFSLFWTPKNGWI